MVIIELRIARAHVHATPLNRDIASVKKEGVARD
jgi:hypothetical protein